MRLRTIICVLSAFVLLLVPRALANPTLLYDPANDKVLYAEEIDRLWHPASVTKIMTAYLAFEAIKAGRFTLQSKIPYSQLAHKMPASKIGLAVGSEVSLDFALRAVIIKSANDISVAVAEAVGGSHDLFVAKMNATAKRLGMSRTHFVNPNGLPSPAQVTTARDLARLARAVIKDFPEYANYWTLSSMRVGKRRLRSHNSLLRKFEGADGMKTGFICDSGYNIVATATRDSRQLVAVVLGERSGSTRGIRAASLLEHGFNTYDWKMFFQSSGINAVPASTKSAATTSLRPKVCGRRRKIRRRKPKARQKKALKKSATVSKPANAVALGLKPRD